MWGLIISKKAMFSVQSINKGKLTFIVHNNLTTTINIICVHQFHIQEVVYFLLSIDVLIHVLVVEVVHQEQHAVFPR